METDLGKRKARLQEEFLEQVVKELEQEEDEIETLIEEKVSQLQKMRKERLAY